MANPYVAALGLVVDVGTKFANGRTEEAFDGLNPFASAGSAQTVVIPTASPKQVAHPHKLGKKPSGWQQTCKMGEGDVWEYQAADDKYFYFETNAGADLTIQIVVS
jgi:hypothetical protein